MQKSLFVFMSFFFALKARFQVSILSFSRLSRSRIMKKFAINRQDFAQVGLQLKFAFRIRPFQSYNYFKLNLFTTK